MDKKEATILFDALVDQIKVASWFTEDWFVYRDGNYIHVAKHGWHDEKHQGIHFEVYVGDAEIGAKEFPIMLHAEADVPQREQFVNRMRTAIQFQIPSFMREADDYTIFKEMHPLDKEIFVAEVLQALEELQFIVPFVDMCLEENTELDIG